jgi:hypothetical protein
LFLDCDGELTLSPNSLYKKESERENIVREIEQMQTDCAKLKNKLNYTPLLDAIKNQKHIFSHRDLEILRAKNTK